MEFESTTKFKPIQDGLRGTQDKKGINPISFYYLNRMELGLGVGIAS